MAPTNVIAPGPADQPVILQNIELSIPVPFEAMMYDPTGQPLRNAVVRAYAVPAGGTSATEVGAARTDETGHLALLLPAGFAKQPVVESSH